MEGQWSLGPLLGSRKTGGVGSERNDLAGTRQAEEPDLLAEFIGQGGEQSEGLIGHRAADACTSVQRFNVPESHNTV